jgi:cation/acetate symporter
MVLLSPGVWTATLKLGTAVFPFDNPALFSVPLAFFTAWIVSTLDCSRAAERERAAFDAQHVQAQTGFGTEQPATSPAT